MTDEQPLPQDDKDYYNNPNYPGVHLEAPEYTAGNPFWRRPGKGRFVPRRGTEQHGVAFNHDAKDFMPTPGSKGVLENVDEAMELAPPMDAILVDPIPVKVVEYPSPLAIQKKTLSNFWTASFNEVFKICDRRPQRFRIRINSLNSNGFRIGPDPDSITYLGFKLQQNFTLEIETTEPLYAINTVGAGGELSIIEEYTSISGGKAL